MDPIYGITLLGFMFLELALAFIYFPYDTGRNFYKLKTGQVETAFSFDPVLGYSLKSNITYSKPTVAPRTAPRRIMFVDVRTDTNGFLFNEDLSTAQQNHQLIFCLGGSSTAGTESRHDRHYPAVIDSMIKKDGYRCINAGVGG